VQYTSNYNLKKPEGTDIVNIDDLNDNADILDQKLKEVENKADSAPPNSVNDAAIGNRTPDQSQAPASPGSGTLSQILSWLANRIKAITGKTNWWEDPPTTLQAAKNHIDASAPHSGHETPSGAQAKVDTHASSKQTHGISSGYYLAKTSRSDQLPAWGDIQGKPDLALASDLAAHQAKTASINAIGHVYAAEFTATLSTSWSGSAAPYTQTVTINGITSDHNPIIDVVMSGTYSTDEARIEAWGYIYRAVTANGSITFYATEKPTVSLPIQIKVVR